MRSAIRALVHPPPPPWSAPGGEPGSGMRIVSLTGPSLPASCRSLALPAIHPIETETFRMRPL